MQIRVPGCQKHKLECLPYAKGCSGEYCAECRKLNYLYFFRKDWAKPAKPLETEFATCPHHDSIRCASGHTFGW